MLSFTLLSTFNLCLVVAANPVVIRDNLIRIPFSKNVNVTQPVQILKQDRARASHHIFRGKGMSGNRLQKDALDNVAVENQALAYLANVYIGNPMTTYTVLVDTGSSNTWVGADEAFKTSSSSVKTSNKVSVVYGSGSFSGAEYTDTFTLGGGLSVKAQSFGAASKSQGFSGIDGVLGLGPTDLTLNSLNPDSDSTIPTITDNLFSQKIISSHEFAISFEPTNLANANTGELTFGGIDNSKFTGPITYAPLTTTSPSSEYWGIDGSIRYGGSTSILSKTAGIIDSGTTLIYLASDAFRKYQKATGGVIDEATGLLKVTTAQFDALESMFFNISGVEFELTPNAQIWPRGLNTFIGGTVNSTYLIVGDLGTPSGEGLDFINGLTFLERFYTVFDSANKRIGFATTPFTNADTN
ncbi:aspartic peptidase A1 [Schizopora paradoxa]|uniref:Aspartic peptidase A1 n=1 Tax=Schizopora paradoxa TaxID=27342 RepID=A0A0H2RIQ2_9AGAM|nr:aspartic peptidase A1 [Schizopora paradoxa]